MDMTIEDESQKKALIHQEHAYFSVMLSEYRKPQNFQEAWHYKDSEEYEGWRISIQKQFK